MSHEMVPPNESGEPMFEVFDQVDRAAQLFIRNQELLGIHNIIEHAVIVADELPPGGNTIARVYRVSVDDGAVQGEWGGVCFLPEDSPLSPRRVYVEVYRVYGTIPMPSNEFTDEQMDIVIRMLNYLEDERDQGRLPDLSQDYTQVAPAGIEADEPRIVVPDISFFLDD